MGLIVPYTATRGKKKIFVSQISANEPSNFCSYQCEIQWESLKKYLKKS